ncbi:MAG: ABC transporter substrate-binding protein [Variibacter sp.]|nr:ABC transporter substrate-binding protein [Variibacter sp.]
MLTRRQFGQTAAAAAAGLVAMPSVLRAQTKKFRLALASGVNDAQVAFNTIGMHERIGWYKQEGVELEIVNTTSTAQPIQLLTNGQAELATTAPGIYFPLMADNPTLPLISGYVWMPRIHNGVVVKPDSKIQSIAELKGKTIGIRNTGDSGYSFLQAVFKQMGIDPQKDVEWLGVGAGGPAGQALYRDAVQAIAIWDVEFVRIEIAGFKLRHLPNPPSAQHLFGNTYLVNKNAVEKDKAAYGRFLRAIAKGQIFTALNPGAAVRLHWDLYPETKPKGKTDEESFKEMIRILEVRRDKWFPQPTAKDQRMGALGPDQWEESRKFIGLLNPKVEKVADVNKLFTTELLDDANKFDRKAFEEEARKFKYA